VIQVQETPTDEEIAEVWRRHTKLGKFLVQEIPPNMLAFAREVAELTATRTGIAVRYHDRQIELWNTKQSASAQTSGGGTPV
jgi:hypothetical protein